MSPLPLAAVVIDDLGDAQRLGTRAVELPGPITYAMLPHAPYAASLASRAHAMDKEVLVHLPMESIGGRRLGPGGLTAALTRPQFERRLRAALRSVPHAIGASNHMGSRLTSLARPMRWLMSALAERPGWLFLDSRTTPYTLAEASARAAGLRATRRDVFLDHRPTRAAIRAQFRRWVATARREGSAVAIGHPRPATLEVLASELPRLAIHGVRLVPLSEVVAHRARRRDADARASVLRVVHSPAPGHAARTR